MSHISGKVALVTGGGGGIGGAICETLAKNGCKVGVMDLMEEPAQRVTKSIISAGGKAIALKADITKRDQVLEAVKKVEQNLGPVDILINSAGVILATPLPKLDINLWNKTVDINVIGMLNCISAVLGGMVNRKSGHVVNMSSVAGRQVIANQLNAAPYFGSKFFVQGFSSGMRQELCRQGIRVTCVCPGTVATGLYDSGMDPDAINSEYLEKMFCEVEPQYRTLFPEDIASTILHIVNQDERVALNEVVIEPTRCSVL